jgi:hypothetical protein
MNVLHRGPLRTSFAAAGAVLAASGLLLSTGLAPSFAADPAPPAPPSTGANVPLSYFGPPPSESFTPGHDQLVGPQQLLKSGTIDPADRSITLPLYLGHTKGGKNVWYILTDTSDERNANALGLNHSAKLAYLVGAGVNHAQLKEDTSLSFDNFTVDFAPQRQLVPGTGAHAFPPKTAHPGSVGDSHYSPYVQIDNAPGTPIYNAPVVAFGDDAATLQKSCTGPVDHTKVHDRVLHICPGSKNSNGQGTVTVATTPVFSFGKPATYISTDSSSDLVATLDSGTFAPALSHLTVGRDDSAFSAVERLFVTANGQTNKGAPAGKANPQRQGLDSALSGEGPPLNVIGGVPNVANDYSPAWDLNLGYWTQEAISHGYTSRVTDEFQILKLVEEGWITGPEGKAYGSIGIIVNCPIIERNL